MSLIGVAIHRLYQKELDQVRTLPGGLRKTFKAITRNIKDYLAKHEFLSWTLRMLLTAVIVAVVWALIHWYNDYARIQTRALAYFAQVGVELKRRNNLIPNLVVSARKYAFHEEEIFKHVSDAREMFINAKDTKQKMQAAMELDNALSKLLAVVERYPDLKATQSIQDLIKELSNTENRIAEQKEKYNEIVRRYNQLLSTFPTNILGRIYGFGQKMPYIGADEDLLETPKVGFEWKGVFPNGSR